MAQIQPINIDFSPLDQAFALRRQALGERADKQEAAQAEQSRANQEQVAFDRGMQILQLKGQQEKDILAQKGEQSTNLQELRGRQEVEQQDDPAAQFRASVPVINNILRQLGDQEDPELLKAFLSELQQFEQFEAFGDLDFSALKGKAPETTKPEEKTFMVGAFKYTEKTAQERLRELEKKANDPDKNNPEQYFPEMNELETGLKQMRGETTQAGTRQDKKDLSPEEEALKFLEDNQF